MLLLYDLFCGATIFSFRIVQQSYIRNNTIVLRRLTVNCCLNSRYDRWYSLLFCLGVKQIYKKDSGERIHPNNNGCYHICVLFHEMRDLTSFLALQTANGNPNLHSSLHVRYSACWNTTNIGTLIFPSR